MKYARQSPTVVWTIVVAIPLTIGCYLLVLLFSPSFIGSSTPNANWSKPVPTTNLNDKRIYIPRLSLNLRYDSGEKALNDGLWHRFPERGDPEKGGNFILAGHRFTIGWNPGETVRKSPLYNVDKLQIGDFIYADFNGVRYQYEIIREYEVKPTQVEIEASSEVPKMTLYTCTLGGEGDGREVLEAKLTKKNISPDDALMVDDSQSQ